MSLTFAVEKCTRRVCGFVIVSLILAKRFTLILPSVFRKLKISLFFSSSSLLLASLSLNSSTPQMRRPLSHVVFGAMKPLV